jgi:putative two-component system hydrogenase maturation factor HypX/HoxX
MRILLLTHSFNSLCQRLFVELEAAGHEVSVEFDINDAVTEEAVALFKPHCLVAPFLKRAIPESVWRSLPCFIVHPGIPGDRGPSALDWAILKGLSRWGVTVLQAEAEMDAGPVWASAEFPMREATKSSLYRNEVTEAAVAAVFMALGRFGRIRAKLAGDGAPNEGIAPHPVPLPLGEGTPELSAAEFIASPLPEGEGQGEGLDALLKGKTADRNANPGIWQPAMKQADRAIDWERDSAATVLRKIRCADGNPGIKSSILGRSVYLYDARPAPHLKGAPGEAIAVSGPAVAVATADGAVWIGHLRDAKSPYPFKLPATRVLSDALAGLPVIPVNSVEGYREIAYEEEGGAGFLHFRFYNGAMGTEACERLLAAYRAALARPTRVLVLMGGPDFWSNGMNLNLIEAAASPADESWRNINAIDDLAHVILSTEGKLTVAALQGNAGAGGVFLARAADYVWLREGVVLSPHYKDMGNLYGSEFWTYSLPRHAGLEMAEAIMRRRLPMGSVEAASIGLANERFGATPDDFAAKARARAIALAAAPDLEDRLAKSQTARVAEEAVKPLAKYREEELARMRLNFYGFDPSYHIARYNFVRKVPKSRTPVTIARHRGQPQQTSGRNAL